MLTCTLASWSLREACEFDMINWIRVESKYHLMGMALGPQLPPLDKNSGRMIDITYLEDRFSSHIGIP